MALGGSCPWVCASPRGWAGGRRGLFGHPAAELGVGAHPETGRCRGSPEAPASRACLLGCDPRCPPRGVWSAACRVPVIFAPQRRRRRAQGVQEPREVSGRHPGRRELVRTECPHQTSSSGGGGREVAIADTWEARSHLHVPKTLEAGGAPPKGGRINSFLRKKEAESGGSAASKRPSRGWRIWSGRLWNPGLGA